LRGEPRRFLLALALCSVLGALGGLLMADLRSEAEPRPRFLPPREQARDFRLTDEDGRATTLSGARGDVVVLTFLYATCWDLCPAQFTKIAQALEKVGGGVTVYGVSVDPVGDTPRRVRKWLDVRGVADAPVHFLIGSRDELQPIWADYGIVPINASDEEAKAAAKAADEFRAQAAKEGLDLASRPYERPERPGPPPAALEAEPDTRDLTYRGRTRHAAGVEYEHSAYVMLIDRRGEQRLGIPFERLDPDSLAQDLRVLLDEPA
jgi:cytochrome oxidase Cu insertion factor (SCO1/SenC/PrrC family)